MLTLKKVKELVGAPSHAKRTPSPKMLYEEGIVLLRREFDQGSHLTVYNSGYVLFSAGKRNTVFHIHDCCGDYAYDAAEGKGDVIEEEYFENCEWHIRALFEGERKMEDNQAKCEGAGRSNVCVSYHALSEDWSEIADRTINMLEKIIENMEQFRRVPLYESYMADEITEEQYRAEVLDYEEAHRKLNEQLTAIMENTMVWERALSLRNPWIQQMEQYKTPEALDRNFVKKYIEQVVVTFLGDKQAEISLTMKTQEWKQMLERIELEVTDNGTKK